MKVKGIAMVGAGFIGPVHVEALKRLNLPVVGILGVNEAESTRAAANLGLPRAYTSFEEVLADPDVTVVHLATPNRLHYPMAKQALEAGKHVLCEKPLAMDSKESSELVELAAKLGLVAAVNYNIRYYPINLHARKLRENGQLGDVYHVTGSYAQDWLFQQTDYNWRVLAAEGGELRAVSDIGTHWLDLIHAVTGLEVEAVCADLKVVFPTRLRPLGEVETYSGKLATEMKTEPVEITTEDFGNIMIKFKGGARGSLWVSQVTAGRKNNLRYEIAGSNEAIAWESEKPNELWIGHRNEPNQSLLRDPALLDGAVRPYISFPGGHNEGFPDSFKQCFRSFYNYIEAGDYSAPATYPTFADGHREIVLCEAILQSHREQRWITL
ncbi:MAG: Gfo/Idh/MocA family protein [Fimbriimonas sp.]